MKIAQLISSYLPDIGGAEICIHNISKVFVRDGHSVTVITPKRLNRDISTTYNLIEIPQIVSVSLFRLFSFSKKLFQNYLFSLQQKYRFDVWQVTIGYPFGSAAIDFFEKQGIPCVLRCAGEDIQIDKKVQYGYRINRRVNGVVRHTYHRFDAHIAITKTMADEYRALNVKDSKITIVPNGIDFERFQGVKKTGHLHEKYSIHPNKKIILSVGRNHPKKGFNLIPLIIKRLLETRDDFVWIVVGKDTHMLNDLRDRSECGDHLITEKQLHGEKATRGDIQVPSDELIRYYRNADLFMLPTYIETFGIVLVEAMAGGLPIVTTDAPGCRDVVEDKKTALVAPVSDIETMTKHIARLLDDETTCSILRNNALAYAKELDWKSIAKQYLSVYESIV